MTLYTPVKGSVRCFHCGQFPVLHRDNECIATCKTCGRPKDDDVLCCEDARNFEAMLRHNETCKGAWTEPPCVDCARRQLIRAEVRGNAYGQARIKELVPSLNKEKSKQLPCTCNRAVEPFEFAKTCKAHGDCPRCETPRSYNAIGMACPNEACPQGDDDMEWW